MFDEDQELYLSYNAPKSLGDAIASMLRSNPEFAEAFTLAVAKDLWLKSNTAPIVNATGEVLFRSGVLFIQIFNPSLRANLNAMRQKICNQLNERMELVKLREVKFV